MRTALLAVLAGAVLAVSGFALGSVLRTATVTDPAEVDILLTPDAAGAYDCPNGAVLAEYDAGSRIYAIGRTQEGSWILARDLDEPGLSVWIPAAMLVGDTSFDSLPVTSCNESGTTVVSTTTTVPQGTTTSEAGSTSSTSSSSTTEPATTTTTKPATTTTTKPATTTTTKPATTTTTKPATTTTTEPDTAPPKMGVPTRSESKIWELDNDVISCPPAYPRESILSVIAEDERSGIAQVRATWTINGQSGSVTMTGSGTYSGAFGPFVYPTVPDSGDEIVVITVTATDGAGNKSSDTVDVRVHSLAGCFG